MKHKLLYLFLLSVIIATGCVKSVNPPAPIVPSGTFTGVFKRYHRHIDTAKYDSLIVNLTVKFKTPSFTFAVTGDTTLHAGSHGAFDLSSQYMLFGDSTVSTNSTKYHLSGAYLYSFDGTNLAFYATSGDTLLNGYALKKTSN
jgi:hypothetical protein